MTDYVNMDGQVAWIAEHCDLATETARTVLAVEHEYMWRAGIARGDDPGTRYFGVDEVEPCGHVDCDLIATVAEGRAGVGYGLAAQVLDGELAYLEMRGMA